ncbi:MAG TPA: hypothetical protein VFH85_06195 [Gammaproteobacteria bacterium]|nr:hypothetical protein [Gammaproteobacteria bacterium]
MVTAHTSTAAREPIRTAIATPLLGLNSHVSEAPPAFHDHIVSMLRKPGIAPVGLLGPTSAAAREAGAKGCGHVLYVALNLTLRDSPEPPSDYAPAGLSELVKERDRTALRFGLYGADHQRRLFDIVEAHAKTDGEDIITPLLVKATGAVADYLQGSVQPASRGKQQRVQPQAVTLQVASF